MAINNEHEGADRNRDEALEETFPASDPPANSGITGDGPPRKPSQRANTEDKPTGLPDSDRHASETAHHDESSEHLTEDQK